MKAALWLRIAAVLSLIHCVLHTIGGVLGQPRHGAEEIAVIDMMQAILLWQVSTLIKRDAAHMKPMIALLFLGWVATAIVSGRYFFIAPVVTELLIAACLAVAFLTAAEVPRGGDRVA